MRIDEAYRMIIENEELEARCGGRVQHAGWGIINRGTPEGTRDISSVETIDGWELYVRKTGERYVPTKTTSAPSLSSESTETRHVKTMVSCRVGTTHL